MVKFEKANDQVLKVICDDIGTVFCRHGAFIGGEAMGGRNFEFSDVMVGADKNVIKRFAKSVGRKASGEDIRLTKCIFKGKSTTYYADGSKEVHIMHLKQGSTLTVQAMYLLAFNEDCDQSLRFFGKGKLIGNGFVSTVLKAKGPNAYVAITSVGQTITLQNSKSTNAIIADPQALVCWAGADPEIALDLDVKMLVGRTSGESYQFVWDADKHASVVLQPFEGDVETKIATAPPADGSKVEKESSVGDMSKAVGAIGEAVGTVAGL